jgi:hypothetical protein
MPGVQVRFAREQDPVSTHVLVIVTGLFGGMAGCAMIGQTMINVRASGACTPGSPPSAPARSS